MRQRLNKKTNTLPGVSLGISQSQEVNSEKVPSHIGTGSRPVARIFERGGGTTGLFSSCAMAGLGKRVKSKA